MKMMRRRVYEVRQVAAGGAAPFSYQLPESLTNPVLLSVFWDFTSNAVLATRLPLMTLRSRSGAVLSTMVSPQSVLASTQVFLSFIPGISQAIPPGNFFQVPLLQALEPFDVLDFSVSSADAGDLSTIAIRYEADETVPVNEP